MSLYYIIDGYNVLKQLPDEADVRLGRDRQSLLDIIKKYNLCGKNRADVVFDGRSDVVGQLHRSQYRVLFSEGESADDVIVKLVKSSPMPKRTIVITNDRELAFKVKNLGAEVKKVAEFAAKINKIKKGHKEKKDYSKSPLNEELKDRINDELRQTWLKYEDNQKKNN